MNKRKCTIDGKMGLIIASYTHTVDVFMFKTRKTMHGVHKRFVKLVPMENNVKTNQLQLEL